MADDPSAIRLPFSFTLTMPSRPPSVAFSRRPNGTVPGDLRRSRQALANLAPLDAVVMVAPPAAIPESFGLPAALLAERLATIGEVTVYSIRICAGALVAEGTAEIIIASLATTGIAGAVLLGLWGLRLFFANAPAASAYLRQLIQTGDPGTALPGPAGSPPLTPPPSLIGSEPGFTPGTLRPIQEAEPASTVRVGPLPGYLPPPPQGLTLSRDWSA